LTESLILANCFYIFKDENDPSAVAVVAGNVK